MISSLTSKDVEYLLFLANQISSKVEANTVLVVVQDHPLGLDHPIVLDYFPAYYLWWRFFIRPWSYINKPSAS
jgi:hypothetical protein